MQSSNPNSEISAPHSLRITPDAMSAMDFKQKIFHRPWVNRENYILTRAGEFQRVAHLGCADAPFTSLLLAQKKLLHLKLFRKQPEVVGFDSSAKAIQILQRACPDGKFVCGNAEMLNEYLEAEAFDLLIAGELVSKLSNPGAFFSACSKALKPDGVLLLTIPSTFGIRRFLHAFFAVENCHPDHISYFSENTIGTLAHRHGFSIFRSRYYGSDTSKSWAKWCLYMCLETLPAYFFGSHFLDGILIEFKKQI